MHKSIAAGALALSLAATGAVAKDKPQPKMKADTVATLSTQNSADPTWVPFTIMMIILIGLISGGAGYKVPV